MSTCLTAPLGVVSLASPSRRHAASWSPATRPPWPSATCRLVLELIKRIGPTSRAEVARSIALSKPTVSAIVEELIGDGTVRELGVESRADAQRGRPPRLIEFSARSQLVIGVHVGVARTQVQLADGLGGEIVDLAAETPAGGPTGCSRGSVSSSRPRWPGLACRRRRCAG